MYIAAAVFGYLLVSFLAAFLIAKMGKIGYWPAFAICCALTPLFALFVVLVFFNKKEE